MSSISATSIALLLVEEAFLYANDLYIQHGNRVEVRLPAMDARESLLTLVFDISEAYA